MTKVKYVTRIDQVRGIPEEELCRLREVTETFAFRSNTYYLGLIDWSDPADPIRRVIIPDPEELDDWGALDASGESAYTVAPGLEHKYQFTAVLLAHDFCGGFCRFCFRKRLFLEGNTEVTRDVEQGLDYIRRHPEINNVLITGGDPLMLSTRRLDYILSRLRGIEHVEIIRLGTKMPAFNPYRILDDDRLVEVLSRYTSPEQRLYAMVHFNHPRELTDPAVRALDRLMRAGLIVANQTPLLRGVNDDPDVLGDLLNKLSYVGAAPYYVFQVRPTRGNRHLVVPIEEAISVFEKARGKASGLARRARLVMSHASGKIEMIGFTGDFVFFRYHRAANPAEKGRFMVFRRNPQATWFDDYLEQGEVFLESALGGLPVNRMGAEVSVFGPRA
ncbi:MAG: KamA family radical SAM protein [Thermoleophilia bacterium]